MESERKKILPAADIDKAAKKLIKSAVISLTQIAEDAEATGCLCRKIIHLKPAQITTHTYDAVRNILRTGMPLAPDCVIVQSDAFITTYPETVFTRFMEFASMRNAAEYRAEQFDCDDSSLVFCAIARKWHARIRAQLEGVESVKKLLPEAPAAPPGACVIPHATAPVGACASPKTRARAIVAASEDAHYIGGSPVGMCHGKLYADGGQHAFNFWISPKGTVVFIEPQTGEFITALGEGAVITVVYL
ncbi:MAG: hypothetical protein M0R66_00440 [Candidatus Omnitrophica bacterium]|nr:hypothetical protein [Candidatus Omnitrophota bacterium]